MSEKQEERQELHNFRANAAVLDGMLETPLADDDYIREWHATWWREDQIYHARIFVSRETNKPKRADVNLTILGTIRMLGAENLTGEQVAAFLGLDAIPAVKWRTNTQKKSKIVVATGMPKFDSRAG